MWYAAIFLWFLATMAAAKRQSRRERVIEQRADGPLRVLLETDIFNTAAADIFSPLFTDFLATRLGEADAKAPLFKGPYRAVTLGVGGGTATARCQLIDTYNKTVTLVRGANIDVSFGDGGKGAWRAQNGQTFLVERIKCDPSFKSVN